MNSYLLRHNQSVPDTWLSPEHGFPFISIPAASPKQNPNLPYLVVAPGLYIIFIIHFPGTLPRAAGLTGSPLCAVPLQGRAVPEDRRGVRE